MGLVETTIYLASFDTGYPHIERAKLEYITIKNHMGASRRGIGLIARPPEKHLSMIDKTNNNQPY